MAIADTIAEKLLQGAAVARGVVSINFGLDDLWQLISTFFADIFAGLAHLLVLSLETLWHLLVAAVSGLGGLWNLVTGFLPHIVADLWHLLVAAVSGAAGVISSGLSGLWHLVAGFFPHLFAALAGAEAAARKLLHGSDVARGLVSFSFGLDGLWQLISGFFADIFSGLVHLLALPFEVIWQWIVAAVSSAANAISSGLGSLWHLVAGFFHNLFAALASAAHQLVLPLEAFWHCLVAAGANAAVAISSCLNGLWRRVVGFLPHLVAVAAGAARVLLPKLEAFWRWAQSAAAAALPYALVAAAVLLLVALVWFFHAAICAATVAVCRALVVVACYLANGLRYAGAAAAGAVSFLLPHCAQCLLCCGRVTMKAPGAAGQLISRAAFEAAPALYFHILHAGGTVVATAVFCARPVAWALAAPVACLFRASASA